MSDNDNVNAPSGSPTKTPKQSGGRWRNLIAISAMAGLVGSGLGWIGHGVGIKNENLPTTGSQYRVAQTDCLNVGLVLETSPGGFASGSGVQVITCLSTRDGSILIASGALLIGPAGAPKLSMSGSNLTLKGTMSGAKLNVTPQSGTAAVLLNGGAKGAHLCYRDTDGAGWTSCDALNGTQSCRVASAGECP